MKAKTPQYTILVDSRESRPYVFPGREVQRIGLPAGDYSILEYMERVRIERKEWGDFYGCLGTNRRRFEAHLERLSTFDFSLLLIEGTIDRLLEQHRFPLPAERGGGIVDSLIPPTAAYNTLFSWMAQYKIPVWLTGTKTKGRNWTLKYLDFAWGHLERERKERERRERKEADNADG